MVVFINSGTFTIMHLPARVVSPRIPTQCRIHLQPSHIPHTHQALYQVSSTVSKSPVGTATAKGVELVAKLGLMAGKEAVKVAVPAAGQVAKWAMTQGAKAAMGAVSGAVSNSVRAGLSGGEGSGGKDKGGNGGGSAGGNVGGSVGGPVQGEKQGVAEGRNGTG